jgi:quinol monooxygenase YgiN
MLSLTLDPQRTAEAHDVIRETLRATRAFDGCQSVDVLVDTDDPTRVVLLERWDSLQSDSAYRAWRATPEGASTLGTVLAQPPALTRFTTAPGV